MNQNSRKISLTAISAGKVACTKSRLELSVNLNISLSLGSQNAEREEENGESLELLTDHPWSPRGD